MSRPGTIGQLEDVAAVVADVLGISNLTPSDLAEVQAERITQAEALVFAQQPTHGVRVSFVLSGHALGRMTQRGHDALSKLICGDSDGTAEPE